MYCSLTAEHSAVEIGISEQRRITASQRFFYVRHIMVTLYGRAVWGAERLAGSFARYANPHAPAHPIGIGRRVLNRLQRSFTMSKSKRAPAQDASPVVKCRKGDLAIRLSGRGMGQIVEVVKYYPIIELDSGIVLTNAWHVRHPSDPHDIDYFKEDKYLLPIRPDDLKETQETDELLSQGVKQ